MAVAEAQFLGEVDVKRALVEDLHRLEGIRHLPEPGARIHLDRTSHLGGDAEEALEAGKPLAGSLLYQKGKEDPRSHPAP